MAWRVLHPRAFDRGVMLSVVFNKEVQQECVLGKDPPENMLNLFMHWPQASQESSLAYLLIYPKLVRWGEWATTFVTKRTASKASAHGYMITAFQETDLLRKSGVQAPFPRSSEAQKSMYREVQGLSLTPPCKLVVINSSVVKLQEGIWGGPDTWLNYIVPWWGLGYSIKSPGFVKEHPIFQMPACPFI